MPDMQTAPDPVTTNNGNDDLDHYACDHDENTAFCGTDVSGIEFTDPTDDDLICVVWADLDDLYASLGICCPKEAFDA